MGGAVRSFPSPHLASCFDRAFSLALCSTPCIHENMMTRECHVWLLVLATLVLTHGICAQSVDCVGTFDWTNFPIGCTRVVGSLILNDFPNATLLGSTNLSTVNEVTGNLGIWGTQLVDVGGSAGLTSLLRVGGTIELRANALLTSVRPLGTLQSFGLLNYFGNPLITQLEGWDNLQTVGSVRIEGAPIVSLAPFHRITQMDTLFLNGPPLPDLK